MMIGDVVGSTELFGRIGTDRSDERGALPAGGVGARHIIPADRRRAGAAARISAPSSAAESERLVGDALPTDLGGAAEAQARFFVQPVSVWVAVLQVRQPRS